MRPVNELKRPGAWGRLALVCLWMGALAWPLAALADKASDRANLAAKYAKEGDTRSERAQFKEAAAAYLKAWKMDPKPQYLWQLARTETLLEQKDVAVEHYRAYIATPGADPRLIAQAREFIDLIEPSSLRARMRTADTAAQSGNHQEASRLYMEAYNLARQRWDALLFKTAVEEQENLQFQQAILHFEDYLAHVAESAPERPEAMARLETLRKQVRGEAVVPLEKAMADASFERSRDLGTTLVYAGGAFLLVGAGSYWWTWHTQSQLEAQLRPGSNRKIHDISLAEARTQVKDVNTHVVVAAAIGGLGLAAAGLGTYLLLRPAPQVAIAPGPGTAGLALSWRF